jgi:hypothetical protein
MIRKFRRIFRSPSNTSPTIKSETIHKTSSSDSTPDDASYVKQGSSTLPHTGKQKILFFLSVYIYLYTIPFLHLSLLRLYIKVKLFFYVCEILFFFLKFSFLASLYILFVYSARRHPAKY